LENFTPLGQNLHRYKADGYVGYEKLYSEREKDKAKQNRTVSGEVA